MDKKTRKLRDIAQRHLKGRKYEKAADAYSQLRDLEPANPRWPHKAGEAFQRLERRDDAIDAFQAAAEAYAEQGFLLKAVALCKLILGLDGDHQQTQQMLAKLYSSPSAPPRPAAQEAAAVEAAKAAPETPPPEPAAPSSVASAASGARPLPPLELASDAIELSAEAPEPSSGLVPARTADFVAPESEFVAPPTAAVGQTAEEDAEKPRARTLPPGETLDAIQLKDIVPDALTEQSTGDGSVFQIPLDDTEFEVAFDDVIEIEEEETAADRIIAQLPPTPLFSSLDRDALQMLIERVELRMYGGGEKIITQGEEGQTLFVLVEGEVVVFHEDTPRREIGRLREGAFFGEIGLLTKRTRSATVETLDDCTVLTISRDVIGDLVEKHPIVLKLLLRFFRERLIDSLVDTSDLFTPFAGPDRLALVKRFSFIEAEAGVSLLTRDEEVDGLYILLSGQAEMARGSGEPRDVAVGELLGDAALLSGASAPYTITTGSKCWLLRMDRSVFHEVILTHPHVLAVISEHAATPETASESPLAAIDSDEISIPII